jgi:hypothetical protein
MHWNVTRFLEPFRVHLHCLQCENVVLKCAHFGEDALKSSRNHDA